MYHDRDMLVLVYSEVQTWSGELGFFVKVRVELGFFPIAALCAGAEQSPAYQG